MQDGPNRLTTHPKVISEGAETFAAGSVTDDRFLADRQPSGAVAVPGRGGAANAMLLRTRSEEGNTPRYKKL
jgi:hypothetical protein